MPITTFTYTIRKHPRAKRLRISVSRDRRVLVTMPSRYPKILAERFVRSKSAWIIETLRKLPVERKLTAAELKQQQKAARVLVHRLVNDYAVRYGFRFGRISIRNQRTRWGSCTKEGNLSFNSRLVTLPPEQQVYIVVHELCHTKEHNHSARFWALVSDILPHYRQLRRELKGVKLG